MPSLEVLAAFIGVLLPLAQLAIGTWNQRKVERRVAQDLLERKLAPADLKILGDYLDQQLGAIDVRRYAQSASAKKRVDRVLERLAEFQGPEEPADSTTAEDAREVISFGETPALTKTRLSNALPEDVESRLYRGDDWGALVKLRSALEAETQRVLAKHGVHETEPMAQVRMLDILARRNLVNADAIGAAHVARKAGNRAAHGQPLEPDEVTSALRAGAFALSELRKVLDEPR